MVVIKIITWTFAALFVVIQFMLIVGVLLDWVEKENFEIQIASITGFIIIMLNIMMITIYWNYSGMPFKSEQHAINLKHVGYVAFYWSVAFIVKLSTTFIEAISPDNIGHYIKDEGDRAES